jgi:hypothetical protein
MKNALKRTGSFLADPAAAIFGIAVFNYIWMWMDSPVRGLLMNMAWATLLLISSLLLLTNKAWGNLTAAILCGCLPLGILGEFLMLPQKVEVQMFSHQHFSYFFGDMRLTPKVLLFIGLNHLILARAVFAVMRMTKARK